MTIDPFGSAPAAPAEDVQVSTGVTNDPWATPPPAAPAAPAPVVVGDGDGKVVMTFKEGTGFDSTWLVVHATSVADAKATLQDPEFKELMDLQKFGATYFRGGAAPAAGGAPRQAAPQGASGPPAGAPAAPGPGWVYKNGITKSGRNQGKMWHGWMPPQGSDEKPVFFDV